MFPPHTPPPPTGGGPRTSARAAPPSEERLHNHRPFGRGTAEAPRALDQGARKGRGAHLDGEPEGATLARDGRVAGDDDVRDAKGAGDVGDVTARRQRGARPPRAGVEHEDSDRVAEVVVGDPEDHLTARPPHATRAPVHRSQPRSSPGPPGVGTMAGTRLGCVRRSRSDVTTLLGRCSLTYTTSAPDATACTAASTLATCILLLLLCV